MNPMGVKPLYFRLDTIDDYLEFKNKFNDVGITKPEDMIFKIYDLFINKIFNDYDYNLPLLVRKLMTMDDQFFSNLYYIIKFYNNHLNHETLTEVTFLISSFLTESGTRIWFNMQQNFLNFNEYGELRTSYKDTITVNRIDKLYITLARYTE